MKSLFLICFTWLLVSSCNHSYNPSGGSPEPGHLDLARELQFTNPDTALMLARSAYEWSQKVNDMEGIAESSLLMGTIMFDMGGLAQANDRLNESLALFLQMKDPGRAAVTYVLLSQVYQRSENYAQAFLYLKKALGAYRTLNDDAGIAGVYGQIGHVYEKEKSYDSALTYQEKALAYYSETRDTFGLASIHDNMGSIYEDLASYDKAGWHFRQALSMNESLENISAATVNLNNLGDIYRKQGDLENALRYTTRAEDYAIRTNQDYQLKSAYRDLSKTYQLLGDTLKAFNYLERSYEMADELFSSEIATEIARTQAMYELQQKQERIAFLEASRSSERLLAVITVVGISAMLLFVGLIFMQHRSKNRKAQRLLEAEAALARVELENTRLSEHTLKTELENNQLREDQLQQELELQRKSLTKSTLHMIQKNEFLHMLRSKLKGLKNTDEASFRKSVKRLIRSIDMNFSIDDDWQEFEAVFQQVHSGFFNNLKEMYPGLSPTEVRLCAMIRLNLHSRDMAAIMGISSDSLRTSRYRLRKRLGLKKGTNLYTYLNSIG